MKYLGKKATLAVVVAQSLITIPAAHAQLEEIIVTAERREASLQETDISITAFDERALKELGVTNFLDVGDLAPNVMMHEMPGKSGGAIAIRGFKNAETISTFEPKVGLYLDGVIIAKGAGSVFEILDLERVEILRGPQGTLYGRNTAGGAVNFITKKPDYELGGNLSATFGNFGRRDYRGTLNLPLIEDTLALKATVGSLVQDGYWDNRDNHPDDGITIPEENLGNKDRNAARLQLQWEPTDNLDVLYTYDMSDIDEGMPPAQLIAFGPAQPGLEPYIADGSQRSVSHNEPGTFVRSEVEGHSVTVNWDINDSLSLVSISSLRAFQVDNFQDADLSPLSILTNQSGDDVETFTQEVRLVGTAMDERLSYVVGGFYMDEDIKEFYTELGWPLFGGLNQRTVGSAQNDIWAVFGEATYSLTDKLDLTLGARYTEEDKTMNKRDSGVFFAGPYDITLPEANENFENISGLVSLTYQWTPDVMTYFKVSEGYVSGGFNPRADDNSLDFWLDGYDEETLINYELGWKTTLLDNRVQLNGAAFYIDYSDLQVNQLTAGARNNIDNAGDATIQGVELEVVAWLNENVTIGGSYGYLDPEYKQFINRAGQDLSNNHWAHSPENTFNAYARFEIPEFQSIGDLVARVDYAWVDDHFLLTSNAPGLVTANAAPSYYFINARVGLNSMEGPNGSDLNVALWVKNLTDELWYTAGYDFTNNILGYAGQSAGPPRTFGIDLSVNF